jgi:uncharacterized protein YdhG (YjbR/CyaY superfamily)
MLPRRKELMSSYNSELNNKDYDKTKGTINLRVLIILKVNLIMKILLNYILKLCI